MRGAAARLAIVAALLASCARPSCPPSRFAVVKDARPFVWEISGPRGKGVLFGTFHAAARGDIPAAALARLAAAHLLVTEIPPLDRDQIAPLTELPRGQSLPELIGADAWIDLMDALAGRIREDRLKRARPWFAMSLLSSAMVDGPDETMDAALVDLARRRGTPQSFLETAEEQLAALGESVSAADLKQAIAERKEMRCSVVDLVAAYRSGDATAVRGALTGDAEAQLLAARNQRWVPIIEDMLADDPFIAVGVSHLVGEGSVPTLLEAHGYTVTRIGAP